MKTPTLRTQRGFSLIELMVGIAISLVLSAIASSIFVGSVRSSRVQEERSKQDETAQLVMELLARDIKSSGFYPPFGTGTFTVGYVAEGGVNPFKAPVTRPNIVNPASPAYNTGIFACDKAKFDRNTGQCETAGDASAPDTLVINYFSDDTFPQTVPPDSTITYPGAGAGTRQNCLNGNVDAGINLAHNVGRQAAGLPVLVTNIYNLSDPQTYGGNNSAITTRSFGCWPLGQANFQPFFTGVEQMRFRFGLFDNSTFQAPARFYSIAEMNALAPLPVINAPRPLTAWERVVSVEVCVMTRSLENNAREAPAGIVINDCDGTPVAAFTNQPRPIVSVNREIFNVRNAAGFTLPVPPL
jgi:type IV pilus assembly protein PilW